MVGLVDALAESGADVIHAHSHRYGHVLAAGAVAARCGIPLVVSTHYHPADRGEPGMKRALLRLQDVGFGMTAYRTARALVVESEREARLVAEFADRHRIRVIPPGIDLGEWAHPSGDRADRLALPPRYLLFVGRIAPNKGLPWLIEALGRFTDRPPPDLVLMGPNWGERAALEAQAHRLGVANHLHWLGLVSDRSRYRAVMRGARALVLPSEWEAFGLVLLEAMAAGTPIIASAVGAVPEVLEDGRAGQLVPYGDAPALADAIRNVLDHPEEAAQRTAHGSTRARAFDWSLAAERHRALYRTLSPR
jgi:glycosyltransferase involved in cell wall biosynthesis